MDIMETNEKKGNAVRFLDAYARIEKDLYGMVRETKYVPFSQLISRAARDNVIVSSRQNDLRQYHELRNAIVHNRGRENEIIAEPCDSVTDDIEQIAALLERKNDILSVASTPVVRVRPDDTIVEVYQTMKRMKTTKIPVYDENGYAGLATIEEIAAWAIRDHDDSDVISSILSSNKNERVVFVRKDSSLQNTVRSFESSMKHGMTLLAIIITAHGSVKEKPLGIITVADLPKLFAIGR